VLWIRIGLIADPYPAFFVNADSDPNPDPTNLEKFPAEKMYICITASGS
jgi:hypothetical protein